MAENFKIFDFSLTDSDMDAISALDRGEVEVTDSDVFGH
jgi:diketogulonate reductase-like aldo/keto reductase